MSIFIALKENGLLNEFFLYVLENLHNSQSFGVLQFTSDDTVEPDFVKDIGGGAGAAMPARRPAPSASDDEGASQLITSAQVATDGNQMPSPTLASETLPDLRWA